MLKNKSLRLTLILVSLFCNISIHASQAANPSPFKKGDTVSITQDWVQKDASYQGLVELNKDAVQNEEKLILSTSSLDFAEKCRTLCNHASCNCTPAQTIAAQLEQKFAPSLIYALHIKNEEEAIAQSDFQYISCLTARDGSKIAPAEFFPNSRKGAGYKIGDMIRAFGSYAYVRYQNKNKTVGCMVPMSYLKAVNAESKYIPKGSKTGLDEMD